MTVLTSLRLCKHGPGCCTYPRQVSNCRMRCGILTELYQRTFFWSQNCLWKKDVQDHRVTVSLAGKDLIVDTEAVGNYLAQSRDQQPVAQEWKHRQWKGKGLDILWFDELDHAQVFDSRHNCEILAKVIRSYSVKETLTTSYGAIG